ncbi:lysozyme [Alloalcanivorax xenomutans]|uniref:lysozyme n=1 Tax=Alloalcanivorax xenomutans TaxID=1094342 RepID=UPI001F41989A|nr:hypothetical protein [Alloalcanivorax xenomutans]MCE7521950.1 hypothetical protein [Alloalcanivorax xenomutans]
MSAITKPGPKGLILAGAAVLAFLKLWEGDQQHIVYADKLAGGLPTVCAGITPHTASRPLAIGDVWTEEECDAEERRIVKETQQALIRCLKVSVPQGVFDALTSHAHNLGWPDTCGSRAVRLMNAGEMSAGCRALAWNPDGSPAWAYSENQYYRGLHRRRLAEMEMCLDGIRGMEGVVGDRPGRGGTDRE